MTRPGYGLRHHAFARGTQIQIRGFRLQPEVRDTCAFCSTAAAFRLKAEATARLLHTRSKPEVFYPRCYDPRMMLLDRELPEAVQNGQHA
jgi:hypothetical protein